MRIAHEYFKPAFNATQSVTRRLLGWRPLEAGSAHLLRLLFLLLLLLLLLSAGCSTLHYPQQAQAWKQALKQGQGEQALASITRHTGGGDQLLYVLEAGRVSQLMGHYQASQEWFQQAAAIYEKNDAAARIRAIGLAQTTAALITNDNAINYHAQPYERIFSYTFQALNYLAQGNAAGAAVEFRRADHAQRQQELAHQREIARAEEKGSNKDKIDTSKYEGYFAGLNGAAALVRSGIQNAYSYYLAAVFWEGRGNYNDALVDYKKALQIMPDVDFIKADIQRASRKLNGKADDGGLLVVALEQGFVPAKEPVGIPIPTDQGVVMVSFPTYQLSRLSNPSPLWVKVDGREIVTQTLARVGAIAAYALKEDMPAILGRQIARTTAKYFMQGAANESSHLLGAIIQLYNLASAQADLRSWLTLPANGQVGRLELPAGSYDIELSLSGSSVTLRVPIRAQGVTLLRVINLGGRLITQIMPIDGEN